MSTFYSHGLCLESFLFLRQGPSVAQAGLEFPILLSIVIADRQGPPHLHAINAYFHVLCVCVGLLLLCVYVCLFVLRIESRNLCIPSKYSTTELWCLLLVVELLSGLRATRTRMTKLEAEILPHLQQTQVIRYRRRHRLSTNREAAAFPRSGQRSPGLAFQLSR